MQRVLIVDDEIEVCKVLQYFLTMKGYEVDTASDGATAIRKVKESRPHIVLLDIKMPGMGGLDVLKKIKAVDPSIGVIMISAVTDNELAKSAMKLGAYDYITKPVDFEYLETVMMVKVVDLLGR